MRIWLIHSAISSWLLIASSGLETSIDQQKEESDDNKIKNVNIETWKVTPRPNAVHQRPARVSRYLFPSLS